MRKAALPSAACSAAVASPASAVAARCSSAAAAAPRRSRWPTTRWSHMERRRAESGRLAWLGSGLGLGLGPSRPAWQWRRAGQESRTGELARAGRPCEPQATQAGRPQGGLALARTWPHGHVASLAAMASPALIASAVSCQLSAPMALTHSFAAEPPGLLMRIFCMCYLRWTVTEFEQACE